MWIGSSILKHLSQIYQWFPTVEPLLLSKKKVHKEFTEGKKVYKTLWLAVVQKNSESFGFWQIKLPWRLCYKLCLYSRGHQEINTETLCLAFLRSSALRKDAGHQRAESIQLTSCLKTASLIPTQGKVLNILCWQLSVSCFFLFYNMFNNEYR